MPRIEVTTATLLYVDDDRQYWFLDLESYDQYSVTRDLIEPAVLSRLHVNPGCLLLFIDDDLTRVLLPFRTAR